MNHSLKASLNINYEHFGNPAWIPGVWKSEIFKLHSGIPLILNSKTRRYQESITLFRNSGIPNFQQCVPACQDFVIPLIRNSGLPESPESVPLIWYSDLHIFRQSRIPDFRNSLSPFCYSAILIIQEFGIPEFRSVPAFRDSMYSEIQDHRSPFQFCDIPGFQISTVRASSAPISPRPFNPLFRLKLEIPQ